MTVCVDKNDQTTNNALALPTAPYTNSRGEYTLAQIDKFAEELANNILADSQKDPVLIAVNRHGDTFYNSYNGLNGFLRSRDDLNLYPDLENRIKISDITALEYADFIRQYNLSPDSAADKRNLNSTNFLFQLNNYYKASFSKSILGGFCDTMGEIFAAIDAFFDLLDDIDQAIDSAIRFLNKIRNFREELTNLSTKKVVEKLIEEITEKLLEFVDEIFASLTEAILGYDIIQFEQDPPPPAGQRIAMRAQALKEEALGFFSEENKEKIKKKIRNMIDYAVGLFENPSLTEIKYLVARFCALASGVEALIKDVKKPLDNFESKYTTVVNRIRNLSNNTTAEAIRNGAVRIAPDVKREAINTMEAQWEYNASAEAFANIDPGVAAAIISDMTPDLTPTGEARNNVPPASAQEYGNLPSYDNIKNGKDSRLGFSGAFKMGRPGWDRVDPRVKVALLRLQDQIGGKLLINSGWRSLEYNRSINGARYSKHLSGLAVDIDKTEIASRGITDIRLTQLAKQSGFKFIKVYPTFYHLDIRE